MSEIEQRMNNAKNLNSVLIIKLGMSLPGESILSFLADSNSQKILMECLKSHSNVIIRSTAIKEISQATVRCSTLLQVRKMNCSELNHREYFDLRIFYGTFINMLFSTKMNLFYAEKLSTCLPFQILYH